MSLNNIQLPGFVYASLFKNLLVDLQETNDVKKEDMQTKIEFLGANGKHIIVVASDTEHKFLADEEMNFLNDLLKACHLTMADIAFINLSHHKGITYQRLIEELNASKILLFGITTQQLDLPFQIPFFQVQSYDEHAFMVAPALSEIQQNQQLKKQLWNSLQKIFNIQKQK